MSELQLFFVVLGLAFGLVLAIAALTGRGSQEQGGRAWTI